MIQAVQQQLLTLNRTFYERVAEPFDATRLASSVGKRALVTRLPLEAWPRPTIADIGCGNGRLAWLLEERNVPLAYVGVDANAQLLAMAQAHTATLHHVRTRFVQANLAEADWPSHLAQSDGQGQVGGFAVVACLATLQHLPGYTLRRRVVGQLAALVAPGGIVAISAWQFLTSSRFAAKLVDWAEVGIDPTQVEEGDALLPWQQGGYAVRYVHQITPDEMGALAADAGLTLEATYFADGKEGNLNLYALLRRAL
jgi:2-polyprenyl-3-methyl-5-hydroxy-6-metoxy-1,4-benzoquinol methylase